MNSNKRCDKDYSILTPTFVILFPSFSRKPFILFSSLCKRSVTTVTSVITMSGKKQQKLYVTERHMLHRKRNILVSEICVRKMISNKMTQVKCPISLEIAGTQDGYHTRRCQEWNYFWKTWPVNGTDLLCPYVQSEVRRWDTTIFKKKDQNVDRCKFA